MWYEDKHDFFFSCKLHHEQWAEGRLLVVNIVNRTSRVHTEECGHTLPRQLTLRRWTVPSSFCCPLDWICHKPPWGPLALCWFWILSNRYHWIAVEMGGHVWVLVFHKNEPVGWQNLAVDLSTDASHRALWHTDTCSHLQLFGVLGKGEL